MSKSELERFLSEGEPQPEPSDFDHLHGWGIRLRSYIDADEPTSELTWTLFRPHASASKSLTRLSIRYRVIMEQILDYLRFTQDRFADFLAPQDDEGKAVEFAYAMDALCRKIEDGVETIQEDQSKTVAGTTAPTDEQKLITAKQAANAAATNDSREELDPPLDLVTLDQIAATVSRSKATLRRYKNQLPAPIQKGRRGQSDQWSWTQVKPILESLFPMRLPDKFPAGRVAFFSCAIPAQPCASEPTVFMHRANPFLRTCDAANQTAQPCQN